MLVALLLAGGALADTSDVPTDVAASPTSTVEPAAPVATVAPAQPCPESGNVVTVSTRKRELWLCRDGAVAAHFEVALGQGGLDKRKKGDRRTPIGTYALGMPRPSGRYGLFIPIVYPTAEQAAQGHTGGDVGIHGPPRRLPEPSYPTTAYDWTLGCVATGSDSEIEAIAEFVRARQPMLVIR